jgi:hypothetical protein
MTIRTTLAIACGAFLLTLGAAAQNPAAALTMKECSAKYQAAQKAGTLNGMKWNDYRKKECGAQAQATPAATTTKSAPATTQSKTKQTASPGNPSAAVYPRIVSPKYSKEKPARARLKTCSDQYNANKAANANGGMKWIQKGGGYWSECNKHLKGAQG